MVGRREVLAGLAAAGLGSRANARGKARPASAPASDLTGVWTNAWYTKLQRPRALKALVLTPSEAEAYESPRRAHAGELVDREHDVVGQNESEFPDNGPGLARIDGQIRSSWIVEPADGRLPWKPGVKAKLGIGADEQPLDNPEQRDEDERCVSIEGAAPILNSHDANVLQIVQTKGWMAVVGEKHHEVRIIRIVPVGEAPTDEPWPAGLWQPDGVSVGHWEGRTLVVETSRLNPGLSKLNDDLWLSGEAKVTERFTRTAPGEIRYDFAVDDPTLFTQPWRAESVFRTAEGRLFEYACHEGNYGLPDILRAARRAEAAKATTAGK